MLRESLRHLVESEDDPVEGSLPTINDNTRDGLVTILVLLVKQIRF